MSTNAKGRLPAAPCGKALKSRKYSPARALRVWAILPWLVAVLALVLAPLVVLVVVLAGAKL